MEPSINQADATIIVADKSAGLRRDCRKLIRAHAGNGSDIRDASTLHAILVLLKETRPGFVVASDEIACGDGVMLADAIRDAGYAGRLLILSTWSQPRQITARVRGDTQVIARTDTHALLPAFLPARREQETRTQPDEIVPFRVEERRIIESAIRRFDGNIGKAAEALELSPSTIYRKIQTWQAKQPA